MNFGGNSTETLEA